MEIRLYWIIICTRLFGMLVLTTLTKIPIKSCIEFLVIYLVI